jgi:hypothetical protein
MFRSLLALPLLLATTGLTVAASVSPDPKTLVIPKQELSKARELVQQLGSEQFNEREEAERELAKMGRAARAALLEGVNNDPSQEVRSRCESLLPKATSLEMKARLEVFLADSEGKYEHDLPGWNQFRAKTRSEWTMLGHTWANRSLDKASRAVFADLLSTPINRQIVMAAGGSDSELGMIVAGRRQELYNQKYGRTMLVGGGFVTTNAAARREPTTEDIAALLFAESLAPAKVVPRAVSISVLITSSGFMNANRTTDEKGKVYQAILIAWLESRQDPMDMYYAMNIASQAGLSEHALRLAIRLFEGKGVVQSYRGMAAAMIARLGNRNHIPLLENALADTAVLTTLRRSIVKDGKQELVTFDIQMRDVALCVSILLAGENPKDYGFSDLYEANGNGIAYSYTRYYFPDDKEKREAAFAKWKAAREAK